MEPYVLSICFKNMPSNRKLKYEKTSGNRELGIAKQDTNAQVNVSKSKKHIYANMPSAYQKTDGMWSYNIVCVISGGTHREKTFLNELGEKNTFRNLEVIFISTSPGEGGLTPNMMNHEYQQICAEGEITAGNRKIKLESVDKIYLFTDMDLYEEELKKLLTEKKNRQSKLDYK